jgi:hypothetical protein
MARKLRPVVVEWFDAHDIQPAEWLDLSSIRTGMKVVSAGLLVSETKKWITITHSVTEDGSARGAFSIPKGCVKSIKRL